MTFFASNKSWKIDHITRFENEKQTDSYHILRQFSPNGNEEIGSLTINPAELQALKNLLKDI